MGPGIASSPGNSPGSARVLSPAPNSAPSGPLPALPENGQPVGPRRRAARAFAERFGGRPEAVAFAPGRINLIGEHVDYCGLPVLPAALPQGIALAFRSAPRARIRCRSTGSGYGETQVGLADPAPSGFGRYLSAAAAGLRSGGWIGPGARGFGGVLASNLPPASGLSSSSALVVAAALAMLAVNGRLRAGAALSREDQRRLAGDLAEAEHGVAIRGGAMDQSVCLGAAPGHALFIEFKPPRWTQVPVARRFSFLAAFSGRRADKGGAAGVLFNRRVRQAEEAISRVQRLLADRSGLPALLRRHGTAALREAGRRLPPSLDRRFRHLVTEADRTRLARLALERGEPTKLGALLDASHESLRRDYEVSTAELDALVRTARDAGAPGARLTGAGLGGSVVILTTPDQRETVRTALISRYYRPRGIEAPERFLLDADPAPGATLHAAP